MDRTDLEVVVIEYMGEASQNLEPILSRAGELDAVLLFDGADALFEKWSDTGNSRDRQEGPLSY